MRNWLIPFLTAAVIGCAPPDSGDSGKDDLDLDGDGTPASEDCDDGDASAYPGATEACDSVDNDCDGDVDEAGATGESTWYTDADGDAYGDGAAPQTACIQPSGTVTDATDCDDTDVLVNPAAQELCNGLDDDCDTTADNGLTFTDYYPDADGDGYGAESELMSACEDPGGMTTVGGDCDDSDGTISPDAVERCDDGDVDEDCDGSADDDDNSVTETLTYYADDDGDGYGDDGSSTSACEQPTDYVREGGDCDDGDDAAYPGALETCNRVDDDCDGDEDNGLTFETWYYDGDGDAYGDASLSVTDCAPVEGYVTDATDCDDGESDINPGAAEVCDDADVDEDCDSLADDDDSSVTGTFTWYVDTDGDGSGDSDGMLATCEMPEGYVDNANDPWEDVAATDFLDSDDISEVTDLVVGSAAIYAVGANADGDGIVVSIDPTSGTVTEIYSGDPIAVPTGIALSADESTLYVADIAAESSSSSVSGGVFAIPVGGGSADELGTGGIVDLPVDVAASADGTMLYVTGLNTSGDGAVFSVDLTARTATEEVSGDPLSDPLAIAVSPGGSMVYVVDSFAADGRGALLAFDTSSWTSTDELASGFNTAFPGGLAMDETGDVAFFTTVGSGDVVAVRTDGSDMETVYDLAGLVPGGISVRSELMYVANLTGPSDLTLLSY